MNRHELLPCPFCGDETVALQSEAWFDAIDGEGSSHFAICLNCSSRADGMPTEEFARMAWNDRACAKEKEAYRLGWEQCRQEMLRATTREGGAQ